MPDPRGRGAHNCLNFYQPVPFTFSCNTSFYNTGKNAHSWTVPEHVFPLQLKTRDVVRSAHTKVIYFKNIQKRFEEMQVRVRKRVKKIFRNAAGVRVSAVKPCTG
jgi:hypothetical protein